MQTHFYNVHQKIVIIDNWRQLGNSGTNNLKGSSRSILYIAISGILPGHTQDVHTSRGR